VVESIAIACILLDDARDGVGQVGRANENPYLTAVEKIGGDGVERKREKI